MQLSDLNKHYHSSLREMDDLRRFVGRVQAMLDRDEAERLEERKKLNEQKALISDVFADSSPQVFYSSIIITLTALLERHIKHIIENISLPPLLGDVGKGKGFLEKFRLQAAGLKINVGEAVWDDMIGMVALRNSFAHGKMARKAQEFADRRGITRYSKTETSLNLDAPDGDIVWLYDKDADVLIRDVARFVESIYCASFNSQP